MSGESGGIGRPNNDAVVGQCDPIAERDGYKLLVARFLGSTFAADFHDGSPLLLLNLLEI